MALQNFGEEKLRVKMLQKLMNKLEQAKLSYSIAFAFSLAPKPSPSARVWLKNGKKDTPSVLINPSRKKIKNVSLSNEQTITANDSSADKID